jgi:hypothetical protein
MSERPFPMAAILSAGVAMGFAGDFLLRADGPPGLNFTLLFVGLAASVLLVSLGGGARISSEAAVWMAVGLVFATGLVWRGSELLRFLAFVAASTAFALPAFRAGRAWVRRANVTELFEAVGSAGLHAALGSGRLFLGSRREARPSEGVSRTAWTVGRSALIGILLAAVPLGIFGSLFVSADPLFARILSDFVRIDLQQFASHVLLAAVLAWLACGYLTGYTAGTRLAALRDLGLRRPSFRAAELAIALGLVDLLFLGFVTVQFRYLFGGAELVEVTPGLTYAAYAREGFFQLVAATALGLPWLLAVDAVFTEREGWGRRVFRALAGAQLVLLLAIEASAVQRMRAYVSAYGLTEDRFLAVTVLGWLALLVLWFGATVLRERRTPFAFGGLVSAFALVAFLHLVNPNARVVRSQLDRAGAPASDVGELVMPVDARYLASLGSDAVPILVGRLDQLDAAGRCTVARRLLSSWGPERPTDWRSWNPADERARRVVREQAVRLQTLAGPDDTCGGVMVPEPTTR